MWKFWTLNLINFNFELNFLNILKKVLIVELQIKTKTSHQTINLRHLKASEKSFTELSPRLVGNRKERKSKYL